MRKELFRIVPPISDFYLFFYWVFRYYPSVRMKCATLSVNRANISIAELNSYNSLSPTEWARLYRFNFKH